MPCDKIARKFQKAFLIYYSWKYKNEWCNDLLYLLCYQIDKLITRMNHLRGNFPNFLQRLHVFCVQYYIENYLSNKWMRFHDVIYKVGLWFCLPDYWLTTDIQYRTSLELLNNGCLLRFTTLNILFVCKQTFSSKLNGHLLNVNCHNVLHQKLVLHWFGKYWCLQK